MCKCTNGATGRNCDHSKFCLSICLSACLSVTAAQCIQAPMCVHVLMERQGYIVTTESFIRLSVCMMVGRSVGGSVGPSVRLSVCLSGVCRSS